jgi:hypothetical protein
MLPLPPLPVLLLLLLPNNEDPTSTPHSPQSSKISFGFMPVGQARHSAAEREPSLETGRVPGHWLQVACLVTLLVKPYQPEAQTAGSSRHGKD